MKVIDQNKAFNSWEQALVPSPSLIDGRTEQDWLCFLSDFGSLLNFYDNNNKISGDWSPFLLKDPVFLLANISKTKFKTYHSLYTRTCLKLAQLVTPSPSTIVQPDQSKDIAISFNQLFDQLTRIFLHIKQWVHYMQQSDSKYELKDFVIGQVETNFSQYLWAIKALRQSLSLTSIIEGLEEAEAVKIHFSGSYEQITWKQNKEKIPYWELLGLKPALTDNDQAAIFNALKKAGDNLFDFFQTVIRRSAVEFEKVKTAKNKYPDTTLLRTFVNLLQIQQEQLNGISHKHLDFYYKDILKQEKQPAVPDKVFVSAELGAKNTAFMLPAGTLLNAGMDAQKNPIVFATTDNVSLNPAAITNAIILSRSPGSSSFFPVYQKNVPTPGILQKDKDGNIQTWGMLPGQSALPLKPAIAFASPLLLLREGFRSIIISLGCAAGADMQVLKNATYYLSTQKLWLDITSFTTVHPPITGIANAPVTIEIDLDNTQPAIEAFLKNPDGLISVWPLLKIEFDSFTDPSVLPALNSLTIEVKASNVKTFQLYNEYGPLSTKAPFQPLGPMPMPGTSFVIGNNEIFSKPLDSLYIEMDWNNLPTDFSIYYQAYNNYLVEGPIPSPPQTKDAIARFFSWLFSLPGRFIRLFSGSSSQTTDTPRTTFNNVDFTVTFDLLQDSDWKTLPAVKQQVVETTGANVTTSGPYQNDSGCVPLADATILLFSTQSSENTTIAGAENKKCILTPNSYFAYGDPSSSIPIPPPTDPAQPKVSDPTIQFGTPKFTDASTSGYLKMVLTGPAIYGFGSQVYPNVVSDIALQNALLVAHPDSSKNFLPPANLPFAPKLTSVVAHYTASQTYNLGTTGNDPIQFFLYTPFANFLVYDNMNGPQPYEGIFFNSANALSLFPCFNYNSALFVSIQNLVPSNTLQLFFQVADNYTASAGKTVEYLYLNGTGWQSLRILLDTTNGLDRSGLVKLDIPADPVNQSALMPGNGYWVCVGIKNSGDLFSQTVFLKTNGFSAQRSGTSFLTSTTAPVLAANAITKPATAIPQIATLVQPFPSFGGKAAETSAVMHRRVGTLLKTKDRAISEEDYSRLIRQQFNDIFYSKPVYDPVNKKTGVYIVKNYSDTTEPNAFLPLVAQGKIDDAQAFLGKRVSPFANLSVSNFDLQYVRVNATISVKPGFEKQGIQKDVVQALNVFLSPWIISSQQQVLIDQGISDAQVVGFIKTIAGVEDVDKFSFQTWVIDSKGQQEYVEVGDPLLSPVNSTTLFVSSMDHDIK